MKKERKISGTLFLSASLLLAVSTQSLAYQNSADISYPYHMEQNIVTTYEETSKPSCASNIAPEAAMLGNAAYEAIAKEIQAMEQDKEISGSASWAKSYKTVGDLVAGSDFAALCKVTQVIPTSNEYKVTPIDVLIGADTCSSTELTITMPGLHPEAKGNTSTSLDCETLEVGAYYVIFTKKEAGDRYIPLNGSVGCFKYNTEKNTVSPLSGILIFPADISYDLLKEEVLEA